MTPLPHSVGLDQPLTVAKEFMREYGIRHLPVQQGGKLVGIVTERDVTFALAVGSGLGVEDAYVPEPYIVQSNTPLAEVASQMAGNRFGCALVVDNGKLVGIFTAVDACRNLAEALNGKPLTSTMN